MVCAAGPMHHSDFGMQEIAKQLGKKVVERSGSFQSPGK